MPRLPGPTLERFLRALLDAHGVGPVPATEVARNLAWNDAAGRHNHGINRLPILLRRLDDGTISRDGAPEETAVSPAFVRMDGHGGLGQYVAACATDRAIALARACGIGGVAVRGSNFFGTGAYFVHRAATAGMACFVFSNSFPKVAVPNGASPVFGTNPLAFGAPGPGGRSILVDMSTAGLAGSTIRAHRDAGTPLPEGLVVDREGRPVTDPDAAASGVLLPAAGAKGFGLALIVEILAGVLSGAGIGRGVGSLYEGVRPADSGHMVLAIDTAQVLSTEAWAERMEILREEVAAGSAGGRARLPGDLRHERLEDAARRGVSLRRSDWKAVVRAAGAARIGVPEVTDAPDPD